MPGEILVTGAAGFIGRHCALLCAASGYQVTALDIKPAPQDVALVCRVLRADLAQPDVLEEVRAGRFAAVINQGGISSTTESDRDLLRRTNTDGPLALADACAASGTRFVYASSHSVYGTFEKGTLIAEDAGPGQCSGPLNRYAASKLALDREMARRPAGPTWVGLRYTNVFGPFEEHKKAMASIISQILRRAAQGERIPVFADTLQASRDYVPVREVAGVCLRLVDAEVPSGIYNLGSGLPVSFATLLEWCAEFTGSPLDVRLVANPLSARYQYWTGADMTKLRAALPGAGRLDIGGVRARARELFDVFEAGKP
ncbi:NAD-dependent epimerase/dehydratase family protein [Actinacidiphila sp. bgisy144]|uniref:NAD-dependent epimerase/dehydratase family protein n=1 Tax=unclassified Actinacidiphila TaxID=2995708 RepID=UPI003EBEB4CF